MTDFPNPTKLGFPHSDHSDHVDGGYCASRSTGRIKGWDDLIGNDTLIWPHCDGLIWPRPRHSGVVVTV